MTITRAALALFLAVGVPAIGIGAWSYRRITNNARVELAASAGIAGAFSLWMLTTSVLARWDRLSTRTSWLLAGALAVAGFAMLLNANPRRARAGGGSRDRAERSARWPWALVAAGVVLACASPLLLQVLVRPDSLIGPTPWYYWETARIFAAADGIPESVVEWGQSVGAFEYHAGFSAPSAFLIQVSGSEQSLAGAALIRILSVLLAVVGMYVLCQRLGANRIAALGSSFGLVAIAVFAAKLTSFRPEAFSYGLTFLAAALFSAGLETRAPWMLAIAGGTAIALTQEHGIGAAICLALMLGIAVAHATSGDATSGAMRNRVVWAAVPLALMCGTIGIFGIVFSSEGAEESIGGDLAELRADGSDPTWEFFQLSSRSDLTGQAPGFGSPTNRDLIRESLESGFTEFPVWGNVVLASAIGLGLLVLAWKDRVSRRALLTFVVTLAALAILAAILAGLSETYVPRRTGFQRILQLWFFTVVVAGSVLASRIRIRRDLATGVWLGGCLAIWAIALPVTWAQIDDQPSARTISELRDLIIEDDATVLTNAYTQGFVSVLTKGQSLLDGQAPYLDPELLGRANQILYDTRAFFGTPATNPFPFDEYDVDYVLVATEPHALGTPVVFPTDYAALSTDPQLELVREGRGFLLYRVV